LQSFQASRLSSELDDDQERRPRLGRDPLGGDLLGGDLLGGDRLGGDLLMFDLLVWLGDLTLIECRGDLERDLGGLLPLLLRTGEGVHLDGTIGRACFTSMRRRFYSSINDICRWTVRRRLSTRAPVGVEFLAVSVGHMGPCRGLFSRGMFCWGIICIASPRGVLTGKGEDVISSCWRTRTSLHMRELAPLAAMVVFEKLWFLVR